MQRDSLYGVFCRWEYSSGNGIIEGFEAFENTRVAVNSKIFWNFRNGWKYRSFRKPPKIVKSKKSMKAEQARGSTRIQSSTAPMSSHHIHRYARAITSKNHAHWNFRYFWELLGYFLSTPVISVYYQPLASWIVQFYAIYPMDNKFRFIWIILWKFILRPKLVFMF